MVLSRGWGRSKRLLPGRFAAEMMKRDFVLSRFFSFRLIGPGSFQPNPVPGDLSQGFGKYSYSVVDFNPIVLVFGILDVLV